MDKYIMFPSPHGDKFQPITAFFTSSSTRFRPLTGINFNINYECANSAQYRFPSPHGDKFQR